MGFFILKCHFCSLILNEHNLCHRDWPVFTGGKKPCVGTGRYYQVPEAMRILNIVGGWTCLLIGVLSIFFVWPFALLMIACGIICLGSASNADYSLHPVAEKGRSMDFGADGPPWAAQEPPILIENRTVFASSIRSISEWGATGPEVVVRGDVRRELPETAMPACVAVTLHSGDCYNVTGGAADRLRKWFNYAA